MMEKIEAAMRMREQMALRALQEEIAFEAEKVRFYIHASIWIHTLTCVHRHLLTHVVIAYQSAT